MTVDRVARAALAATAVVALGLGGWAAHTAFAPGQTYDIHPSYAFDVTDKPQLAGHSTDVFVGTVTGIAATEVRNDTAHTIFNVQVVQALKGDAAGTVRIAQLGGTIGKETWRPDDQQPLEIGESYVLAAAGSDELTLTAGPASNEKITTEAGRRSASASDPLVSEWKTAIVNQRKPDALTK